MATIRYYTAGESHGQCLVGIIEGIPAGLEICEDDISVDLRRRQMGYGRGARMKIEKDRAEILSGVRFGHTLGSPIAVLIKNKDWKNWKGRMATTKVEEKGEPVLIPRPGHADLAGAIKYSHKDIRNVIERASARETTARVALGAFARKFLGELGIFVVSHVYQIHTVRHNFSAAHLNSDQELEMPLVTLSKDADKNPLRCLDASVAEKMVEQIDRARKNKNTVGGAFEVIALNLPIGLGSHVHWDRKLDGRIAGAFMSIPAIKGVGIGAGFESANLSGSEMHDLICFDKSKNRFYHSTNRAGGLEGGITNGMPLVVRVAMKPLATLMNPLSSVNIATHQSAVAHIERSDVCAVPAASIIGESILSLVLSETILEKFGGDSLDEIRDRYNAWGNTGN